PITRRTASRSCAGKFLRSRRLTWISRRGRRRSSRSPPASMSWAQEERARDDLSRERTLFAPARGGRTSACLAYPNPYGPGMGNLGFRAVYRIFATTPGYRCERAFLPDADAGSERVFSLESRRSAGEFDLFALSISFETDYLNVPAMLEGAGLPLRSRERDERHPLVIAGGSGVFLNPEPIADLVDPFLVAEAE